MDQIYSRWPKHLKHCSSCSIL